MVRDNSIASLIVEICQILNNKSYLAAGDGNVSCLLGNEQLLITPAGRNKRFINSDELSKLSLNGEILKGSPSTESAMHLYIYNHCPNARAVIHAHPPAAIGWSIAHPEADYFPIDALPEVILGVGAIPVCRYGIPGSFELAQSLDPYLPDMRAMILARHGVVAWGESLEEAFNGVERIEHAALVMAHANFWGGAVSLEARILDLLVAKRKNAGFKNL